MNLRGVLQSQYLASLAMLREAIRRCPPALWSAGADEEQAWFKAYHAVYYAHKYLQPSGKDFVRWKGRTRTNGGVAISKAELLEYLQYVEAQVPERLGRAKFDAGSGFSSYPEADRLEMHLINIRHIQQHAGELCERLGDRARVKLRWAGHVHRKAE